MANEAREMQARQKQAVSQEPTRQGLIFRPDVDIVERPDAYLVTADLPGVDENHVKIRFEEGVLSIDADLAVKPDPSWAPLYSEYPVGGFHRDFAVSDRIDVDKIEARMRDGVLELVLPKAEQARRREIPVQTG